MIDSVGDVLIGNSAGGLLAAAKMLVIGENVAAVYELYHLGLHKGKNSRATTLALPAASW